MKITYNGIKFDSELEVDYYKYLTELNVQFIYHPKCPIKLNRSNTYTPDFIVIYDNRVEIVETKGYSQFSFMKDNMIHNVMLEKTTEELAQFLYDNDVYDLKGKDIIYRKIKHLKAYGWVDFDFKNPNTLANKRKEKITILEAENKELKAKVKDYERYFSYLFKDKLTKNQKEWKNNFEKRLKTIK